MLYHVRSANLLMRAVDFDNNEHSDCIGIHVQDIRQVFEFLIILLEILLQKLLLSNFL